MEIRITDLRALDGDSLVAVHVLILSEQGERDARLYHIIPEQYAAMKLRCGVIDPETVDALEEASRQTEAIRKALHLLSYGAQSEKTLKQKLSARGFSGEQTKVAVDYLRRLGMIRESEEAMRVAQSCRRKYWGLRRILSHLFQKGYSESVIREVQAELEGEDFAADCAALIRSKFYEVPSGREERQKMTAALMRYGYSLGEIRRAIDLVTQEGEA